MAVEELAASGFIELVVYALLISEAVGNILQLN